MTTADAHLFSHLLPQPRHPLPEALPSQTHDELLRCAKVWACPALIEDIKFQHSTRMSRALAKCLPEQAIVRISQYLLTEGWFNYYDEVICHELAHYVVWIRHGRAPRPHGREWKDLMRQAGHTPRVTLPRPENAQAIPTRSIRKSKRPRYMYQYTCPHGHGERWSGRLMRSWRCTICIQEGRDGRLDIMRYRK